VNQVFVLLWLADVVDNLSTICGFLLILCVASFVLWFTINAVAICCDDELTDRGRVSMDKLSRLALRVSACLLVPSVLFLILPSKATVQAAAAAQTFDVAASTQLGQDAVDALRRVLKKIGN